jgi:hypothetical protein
VYWRGAFLYNFFFLQSGGELAGLGIRKGYVGKLLNEGTLDQADSMFLQE